MTLDPTDLARFVPSNAPSDVQPSTELWNQIFPWDDLQAKSPPTHHLKFGSDVLPTISVLAAGGGVNQKLLKTDGNSRLLTAASPTISDAFLNAAVAGTTNIAPRDITLYQPGQYVLLAKNVATGPNSELKLIDQVIPGSSPPVLVLDRALGVGYAAGDPIVIVPPVAIVGHRPPKRPYDFETFSDPGGNVQATITIVGTANRIIVLDEMEWTLWQNAAGAGAARANVWDGAVGSGTVLWRTIMSTDAQNQVDHLYRTDLNLRGTAGNDMNIQFDAAVTADTEVIQVAGWFENPGFGYLS